MPDDPYTILQVTPQDTAESIKLSYRRLAKQYHPDLHGKDSSEQMRQINAAYALLGEPQRRRAYDQAQSRAYRVSTMPRQGRVVDDSVLLAQWLIKVYYPVDRYLRQIINPFAKHLEELAYDPYDDTYVEAFQRYLNRCEKLLNQAWDCYSAQPNPRGAARIAEYLYHALNQLRDSLDELSYFCQNYDYSHLHTGQELLTIVREMSDNAAAYVKCNQTVF